MPALNTTQLTADLLNFDQEFDLFPNPELRSPMHFMWSDFDEFCQHYSQKLSMQGDFAKMYEAKIKEISLLKNIPVWVKKDSKIFTTHLFDIYESHLYQKSIFDHDSTAPLDISFISPSGPFKKMAITDCLNIQNYQDFVFISLLKNKLPLREFRLRFNSRLLFEAGANFEKTLLGDLCQITTKGMLFKVKGPEFFKALKDTSAIRLLMNTQILESSRHCNTWKELKSHVETWPNHPLYTQNKVDAFLVDPKLIQLAQRFDYGRTSEIYFFVTFDHLTSTHQIMVKKIQNFLSLAKSCIKNSMQKSA